MATTYNNLYLDIRQQLRRAGIEEATLEARELVCFGTNKSRDAFQPDIGPEFSFPFREFDDAYPGRQTPIGIFSGRNPSIT